MTLGGCRDAALDEPGVLARAERERERHRLEIIRAHALPHSASAHDNTSTALLGDCESAAPHHLP